MKKLVIVAALAVCAGSLHAQGTIVFNNRITGSIVAPVYLPEPGAGTTVKTGNTAAGTPAGTQTYGGTNPGGSGFTAQLWAGTNNAPESSLAPVAVGGTTDFRAGAAAGFVNQPTGSTVIAGVPGGANAQLQIRVWDNRGGTVTTWAAAQALASSGEILGKSALFASGALGGTDPAGGPDFTPPNMVNLRSFNLQQVPEPSTIALGVLGVGALLLRRRK